MEPDRALALCQWKMSETLLGIFKLGGVKLRRAQTRVKVLIDSLFSFYVETGELAPSTLYTLVSLPLVTDGPSTSSYLGQWFLARI